MSTGRRADENISRCQIPVNDLFARKKAHAIAHLLRERDEIDTGEKFTGRWWHFDAHMITVQLKVHRVGRCDGRRLDMIVVKLIVHLIAHKERPCRLTAEISLIFIQHCRFAVIKSQLTGEFSTQQLEEVARIAELGEQHQLFDVGRAMTDDADDVGMTTDRLHDGDFLVELLDVFEI